MEEPASVHRHRSRLIDETGMVVVPVKAGAFQVVVQRRGAEVADLDVVGVAVAAVGLERLARVAIGEERQIKAKGHSTRSRTVGERLAVSGYQHLRFPVQ